MSKCAGQVDRLNGYLGLQLEKKKSRNRVSDRPIELFSSSHQKEIYFFPALAMMIF